MNTLHIEKPNMSTNWFSYRKYEICRFYRVYLKKGIRQSWYKKINPLLTTTWPTTNLLPELPLIVQTRPHCRIISIERRTEERNNILEQVNIRNIGVEDKINMEERNNILELLKGPWSRNGSDLEFASEGQKRDRAIVMASVKQYGKALQFASEDLQKDREIVMAAVKQSGWALKLYQRIFRETGRYWWLQWRIMGGRSS